MGRFGATWKGRQARENEYCETRAMCNANDNGGHVGFLQIERHFEDFLDGNVELDTHRFEREKRRSERDEFREEGAFGFLGRLCVKVGRIEEQDGIVQLDRLFRDRLCRCVELDGRFGLVSTGEREAKGDRVVDGQRAVVEAIHLVVELREFASQLRNLQLFVQNVLL